MADRFLCTQCGTESPYDPPNVAECLCGGDFVPESELEAARAEMRQEEEEMKAMATNNHAPLPLAFAVTSAPLGPRSGKTPPHPGAVAIWELWRQLCAGVVVELEEPLLVDVDPASPAVVRFLFPPPLGWAMAFSVARDSPGVAAVRDLLACWQATVEQQAEAERQALEPAGKGARTETSKD